MEPGLQWLDYLGQPCKHAVEIGLALLAQSSLILLTGLGVGWLARRSSPASLRALYRATLASIFLACFVSLLLTGRVPALGGFSLPDANTDSVPAASEYTAPTAMSEVPIIVDAPAPLPEQPPHLQAPESPAPLPSLPPPDQHSVLGILYVSLASLWLAGAGALLLWTLLCYISVRRIRLRSHAVAEIRILSALSELSAKAGVRSPLLLMSREIVSPFVFGLRNPTLILPARLCERSDPPALRAIFAHELAHIKANDAAWMLFARLSCTMFWMHPLFWALISGLEQASEEACDREAVAANLSPQEYARCLLDIAEQYQHGRPERVTGTGMALSRSSLGRRIARILCGPNQSNRALTTLQNAAVLLLFTSLAAMSGWLVAAQFAPKPVSPPITPQPPLEITQPVVLTPLESPDIAPEVQSVAVAQDTADQDSKRAEEHARLEEREADLQQRAAALAQAAQESQEKRREADDKRLYAADMLLARKAQIKAEVDSLNQYLLASETELLELSQKYRESHPKIRNGIQQLNELTAKRDALQAQLFDLDRQIRILQRSEDASRKPASAPEQKDAEARLRVIKEIRGNLMKKRAAALLALEQLKQKYSSDHPAVKKAQMQVDLLERLNADYAEQSTKAQRQNKAGIPTDTLLYNYFVAFGFDTDKIELEVGPNQKNPQQSEMDAWQQSYRVEGTVTCVMEFTDKEGKLLRKTISVLQNPTVENTRKGIKTTYAFNGSPEARKNAPSNAVAGSYHYEFHIKSGKDSGSNPEKVVSSDAQRFPIKPQTTP